MTLRSSFRPLPFLVSLIAFCGCILLAAPTAEAFWPFSHKKVPVTIAAPEVTQHPAVQPTPPDETIPKETCEPIRLEIVALRQRQGWWFNPIDEIRIASKTRKHRRCQDTFRDKEWEYLKHANPLPNEPIFPKGM
ncbi:MAG: hypothetical protein QE263_03545 [Vampirovibrionales bacterium]|nr:hypothetical protein [Vampirovibrionales bacterium]